ncbi:MAG: YceI family protein [Chromatiaceae bacterium]|nr:YceI family protein [Chromatiaceae bacterium]
MRFVLTTLTLALILATTSTWAEWKMLPDKSHLSFVSIKKEHVAETHTFKSLQGSVNDAGIGTVSVDLASVDTRIESRDKQLRETLFQIKEHPTAVYTVGLDDTTVTRISELPAGDQLTITLDGELSLHGAKQPLSADVIVTKSGVNRVQVASARPVVVQAEKFGLVEGINKLAEIASLTSISYAVPVSFVLTFDVLTP